MAQQWNLELVKKEALKYKLKTELRNNAKGAYRWALRNSLLEEVCSHMKKPVKWNFNKVKKKAIKCKSRIEFRDNYGAAYKWSLRNSILDEVCSHMPLPKGNAKAKKIKPIFKENKTRRTWDFELVKKEALKYKIKEEFKRSASGAYNWAQRKKKLDIVCKHMKKTIRWDLEKVKEEALKHVYKIDFRKKSGGAYFWAKHNKCLDEVCKHMIKKTKKNLPIWNYLLVKNEAKKYKIREKFRIGNRSAYNWALKNKKLDKVCSHIERAKCGFNPEKIGYVYYVRIEKDGRELYKIGITNLSVESRFREEMKYVTVIKVWEFDNGSDAYKLEQEILNDYSYAKYNGENILKTGNTEMFVDDVLMLDIDAA